MKRVIKNVLLRGKYQRQLFQRNPLWQKNVFVKSLQKTSAQLQAVWWKNIHIKTQKESAFWVPHRVLAFCVKDVQEMLLPKSSVHGEQTSHCHRLQALLTTQVVRGFEVSVYNKHTVKPGSVLRFHSCETTNSKNLKYAFLHLLGILISNDRRSKLNTVFKLSHLHCTEAIYRLSSSCHLNKAWRPEGYDDISIHHNSDRGPGWQSLMCTGIDVYFCIEINADKNFLHSFITNYRYKQMHNNNA